MSKWLLTAAIISLGAAFIATDAEARRFGGGRSIGAQRNATTPPPAQTPAKQAAPAQQNPNQAAPATSGSRWMPILGGLALGGILGYLFGGSGLLGFLLVALLAIAVLVGVRALMRRRAETPQPVQFAGTRERVDVVPPPASQTRVVVNSRVPAGFDSGSFLRAAKHNFLRLQAANDAGELDEIRDFTTDELYEELKKDLAPGGQTEVNGLEAELLELTTEGKEHWASVRFSGRVRETAGQEPQAFSEVWNLVKPASGASGWLLAGIQQMH